VFSTVVDSIQDMCVFPSHRNSARITVALSLALLPGCLVQFTAPIAKEDLDDIELLSADATGALLMDDLLSDPVQLLNFREKMGGLLDGFLSLMPCPMGALVERSFDIFTLRDTRNGR
jgi:hypothetical protein